jgi:hypothetical protein
VIGRLGAKMADYAFGSNPPYALSPYSDLNDFIASAKPAVECIRQHTLLDLLGVS